MIAQHSAQQFLTEWMEALKLGWYFEEQGEGADIYFYVHSPPHSELENICTSHEFIDIGGIRVYVPGYFWPSRVIVAEQEPVNKRKADEEIEGSPSNKRVKKIIECIELE